MTPTQSFFRPTSIRFLLGLLLLVISSALSAQPTLTPNNHTPQIGEIGYARDCYLGTAGPGASGANQSWDFSNCDTVGRGEVGDIVLDPSVQPLFPTADLAVISGLTMNSLTADNQGISIIGQEDLLFGNLKVFSDPIAIMEFPMTYGTAFQDSFTGIEIYLGDTTPSLGSILVEADGYGDIITPAGTFTNVLRKKEYITETFMPASGPAEVIETNSYYWYQPGNPFPIFIWREILIDGSLVSSYGRLYIRHTVEVEEAMAKESINIFPNPCSGTVNVQFQQPIPGAYTLSLWDMQGKQIWVKKDAAPGLGRVTEQIDLTGIERGLYLVKYESEAGAVVRKMIVE